MHLRNFDFCNQSLHFLNKNYFVAKVDLPNNIFSSFGLIEKSYKLATSFSRIFLFCCLLVLAYFLFNTAIFHFVDSNFLPLVSDACCYICYVSSIRTDTERK